MQPIVTIVTVAYNARDAVQITIRNIEQQTFKNYEYIVIDGASTDGTVKMLEEYSGIPIKWVSEPDKGIYDAMNKGVLLAKGHWIIFMNAGDKFATKDVLSKVFTVAPTTDVIYGDVVKNGVVKKAEKPHNAHRMFFCHQSCFIRKSCLTDFPFDIKHKMSADFKQIKQLWYAKKSFTQLYFPIAEYDTTGISNTNRSKGLLDNIKVIWEEDTFIEKTKLLPRILFVYLICKLRGK